MEKVKAKGINSYVESCGLVVIFETYNKETNDNKAFVLGYDEIMGTDAHVDAIANEVTRIIARHYDRNRIVRLVHLRSQFSF